MASLRPHTHGVRRACSHTPLRRRHVAHLDLPRHATSRATRHAARRARTDPRARARRRLAGVIFKSVGDGRPYPAHGLAPGAWASLAPRQIRLADLITTKRTLDLEALLDEQSTFYGDLFAHVVQWQGQLYLEDGLHRALRTSLHGRPVLHARVLDLDDPDRQAHATTATTTGGARR